MNTGRLLAGLAVLVIAAALWVVNCSGPRPEVGAVNLSAPSAPDEPYRIEAAVRNTGPGHGEVAVTIRLRDRASGQTFQDDRTISLEAGETARVVAEIQAPPGSYEPEVEAEYPPR